MHTHATCHVVYMLEPLRKQIGLSPLEPASASSPVALSWCAACVHLEQLTHYPHFGYTNKSLYMYGLCAFFRL